MAKKIGCIVMYSKPLEKHKTVPCGTIFYSDGTEEEVSLKEAAEKALTMALDYGYVNAIDNERYFNTTYEDFTNNKSKYMSIAKGENETKKSTVKTTTVKTPTKPRKLPTNITEVDPPTRVHDKTKEPVVKQEIINNHQVIYGPNPYINKPIPVEKKVEPVVKQEVIENHQVLYGPAPERIVQEVNMEQDLYGPAPPEMVEDSEDIDFDSIEKKLNEVLDMTEASGERIKTPTQDDLLKMIQEQNQKVDASNQKKR